MRTFFVLALSNVLAVLVHSAYNCNRMDDCQNSGTCQANGTCTCTNETNTYYNCQYNTAETTCTTKVCHNGGTCVTTADLVNVCACPYGHYGVLCEKDQVEIICGGSTSEFKIALPSKFAGKVEVTHETTVPDCNPVETSDDGFKQYSVTFDLTANVSENCPSSNLEIETVDGNTAYTAKFLVRYSADLTTSLDELYTLTCTHVGGSVTVSKEITDIQVNTMHIDPVTKNATISPVKMTLLKDNIQLTGTLYIGEEFEVVINVDNPDAFSDILIQSCVANDTKTPEPKTFKIFDEGCPTADGKKTTTEQSVAAGDGTGAARSITITAFKFRDSQKLGIVCTVRLCKNGDTSCEAPTNCEEIRNSATRKKRAADVNPEEMLSTVVTVLSPGETVTVPSTDGNANAATVTGTCFAQTSIVSVVAILVALVGILLVACFAMCCYITRKRSEPKLSDSVRGAEFHIPRAHINVAFGE